MSSGSSASDRGAAHCTTERRAPSALLTPSAGAVLIPLTLALPALYFVLRTAWFAAHEPFGRDQGIFQYISFALSHGQRDYADFREMNGPLPHAIYLALYALAGHDELRFRVIDTVASGLVFFGVGMAIPGVGWRKGDAPARAPMGVRLAWGLASFVALFSYYFLYKWWDRTQRESFYLLFFLTSLGLQLLAQIPSDAGARRRVWLLAAAGAASILPTFGKPTCVLFFVAQITALLLDDEMPLERRRRAVAFAGGALAGCVPVVAWVLVYTDPHAMLADGYQIARVYRFVWSKSLADAYVAWGNGPLMNDGVATAAAAVPLVALRIVPRRVWPAVFFLFAALATFAVQRKGFPYHVQPTTASAHLLWLLTIAVIAERSVANRRVLFVGAELAAALLSWHFIDNVTLCQTMRDAPQWYADSLSPEARRERLAQHFNDGDFRLLDLQRAGRYLKEVTEPSDRVQLYGMDPYVLFFAERLSATPFLYSFELNVDSALAGGSGGAPSESEKAWIARYGAENVAQMTAAVEAAPPAAFVLIDNQPFSYPQDADADFRAHCPEAYAMMVHGYTRAAFGAVRVWLRNDRAARAAHAPGG
jgi:hypothetical protein